MSSAQSKKLTANIKAQGCAAKLSPLELAQIVRSLPPFQSDKLLCDTKNFEDAAVYKISDDLALVSTIDFFPALMDDPFLYGRVAAVNALSDVYAMGGAPLFALNVFCFPTCDYPLSVAEEIIAGGASALLEANCLLVGGHSIQTSEPIYGLAVTGTVNPKRILTNGGAKESDAIVLCKALGTGIALLSQKGQELDSQAYESLIASLSRLNGPCLQIALEFDIHAATDVTGFGLLGHLHEMAKACNLKVRVDSSSLPILPDVLRCAELGLVPAAAYANRKSYEAISLIEESVSLALTDLLYDPQTSGGLLFALAADEARQLVSNLQNANWPAAIIGQFAEGDNPGFVEVY